MIPNCRVEEPDFGHPAVGIVKVAFDTLRCCEPLQSDQVTSQDCERFVRDKVVDRGIHALFECDG